jgi:hypothetical protein
MFETHLYQFEQELVDFEQQLAKNNYVSLDKIWGNEEFLEIELLGPL